LRKLAASQAWREATESSEESQLSALPGTVLVSSIAPSPRWCSPQDAKYASFAQQLSSSVSEYFGYVTRRPGKRGEHR
jgi:hypothetical protein